jgi:hypothetical protein
MTSVRPSSRPSCRVDQSNRKSLMYCRLEGFITSLRDMTPPCIALRYREGAPQRKRRKNEPK